MSFKRFLRENNIVSAPVIGAAYPKTNKMACLIHAVELKNGDPHRVLCGNVKIEHIMDDETQHDKHKVTCPACLKKMKK